jgi:hypothetical protein
MVLFGSDLSRKRTPALDVVEPFLLAGARGVIAGAFTQADAMLNPGGRVWLLPLGLPTPAAWVRLALREFSGLDPERVPSPPDWWTTGSWATPEQRNARSALRETTERREQVLRELSVDIAQALDAAVEADLRATAGALRLLTADGDELEEAVLDALTAFGFIATVMDEVYPPGDRREDLQLRDPDVDGWLALVEIKGYSRGAAVNDLARIERHTSRFAADNAGALPSAKFHVVNAFKGTDPASRPAAIPNDDELREFAAGGGLLIDTRDLFTAWCSVESGARESTDVRRSLRESAMRWIAPVIE